MTAQVMEDVIGDPPHTHKVVLTIFSNGDDGMISIKSEWSPDSEGEAIEKLGYLPASYEMIQEYILPAIEQAYLDWEVGPALKLPSPSNRVH